MKNMQPVPGSNRGPSAYRANALPTELSKLPTHNSPVPVLPKSLPLHYSPFFSLDSRGGGSVNNYMYTLHTHGAQCNGQPQHQTVTGLMKNMQPDFLRGTFILLHDLYTYVVVSELRQSVIRTGLGLWSLINRIKLHILWIWMQQKYTFFESLIIWAQNAPHVIWN